MESIWCWVKLNWVDIIGVLGFLMALTTCILSAINQRRKIRLRIIYHYRNTENLVFLVSFENLSRLPILITQIYLVNENGDKLECRAESKKVFVTTNRKGNEVVGREVQKNIQLPISLPSLGGISGLIVFARHRDIFPVLSTELNFQVHTNRGGSFLLKLPPGEPRNLRDIL